MGVIGRRERRNLMQPGQNCGMYPEGTAAYPEPAAPPKQGTNRRLAGMDAIATDGSTSTLGLMTIFIALLFLLYALFAHRQRGRASKQRIITKLLVARADSAEPKIRV